jgi:hypothetical protein
MRGGNCREMAEDKRESQLHVGDAQSTDHSFFHSEHSDTMSQPQYAPAATAGGQQNGPVSSIPSAIRLT